MKGAATPRLMDAAGIDMMAAYSAAIAKASRFNRKLKSIT